MNTLFDINRFIDAAEKQQQRCVEHLPESVKTHASELTVAQYEFARSATATASRAAKIMTESVTDAAKKIRERFTV